MLTHSITSLRLITSDKPSNVKTLSWRHGGRDFGINKTHKTHLLTFDGLSSKHFCDPCRLFERNEAL